MWDAGQPLSVPMESSYWVGKNLYLLLTPKQGLWSARGTPYPSLLVKLRSLSSASFLLLPLCFESRVSAFYPFHWSQGALSVQDWGERC